MRVYAYYIGGISNIIHSLVKILDLCEGNEESSEDTTGCKASVCEESDDCPRVGKFVELLSFRHFDRFFTFSKSTEKTNPIRELD